MSNFPTAAFEHYWTMWNAQDLSTVRHHLELAVTEDFIFCDPIHWHVGRDALEENVRAFRNERPRAVFKMGSGYDTHHNRYRYEWHFTLKDKVFLEGFDVATVADDGLIERVDGFFGELPPLGG